MAVNNEKIRIVFKIVIFNVGSCLEYREIKNILSTCKTLRDTDFVDKNNKYNISNVFRCDGCGKLALKEAHVHQGCFDFSYGSMWCCLNNNINRGLCHPYFSYKPFLCKELKNITVIETVRHNGPDNVISCLCHYSVSKVYRNSYKTKVEAYTGKYPSSNDLTFGQIIDSQKLHLEEFNKTDLSDRFKKTRINRQMTTRRFHKFRKKMKDQRSWKKYGEFPIYQIRHKMWDGAPKPKESRTKKKKYLKYQMSHSQ